MRSDFVKEQESITLCMKDNKYYEAIDICNKVLNNIEEDDSDNNNYKWQFNLKLSVLYKKLGQIEKSFDYAQKSMSYVQTQNQYIECIWLMGNCYQLKGDNAKALKFYEKCKEYYQRNVMTNEFLRISFNIARLTKNERLLKAVIELYKKNNVLQSSIDNAYVCLCNLYIDKGQYKEAEHTIHNIANDNKVLELRNKMIDANVSNIL